MKALSKPLAVALYAPDPGRGLEPELQGGLEERLRAGVLSPRGRGDDRARVRPQPRRRRPEGLGQGAVLLPAQAAGPLGAAGCPRASRLPAVFCLAARGGDCARPDRRAARGRRGTADRRGRGGGCALGRVARSASRSRKPPLASRSPREAPAPRCSSCPSGRSRTRSRCTAAMTHGAPWSTATPATDLPTTPPSVGSAAARAGRAGRAARARAPPRPGRRVRAGRRGASRARTVRGRRALARGAAGPERLPAARDRSRGPSRSSVLASRARLSTAAPSGPSSSSPRPGPLGGVLLHFGAGVSGLPAAVTVETGDAGGWTIHVARPGRRPRPARGAAGPRRVPVVIETPGASGRLFRIRVDGVWTIEEVVPLAPRAERASADEPPPDGAQGPQQRESDARPEQERRPQADPLP